MNGNSDNEHTAKKARHAGHVVLNMGGTRFSTSITTLSNSSAYFESLFSHEWAESRDNGDGEEVFVDQDPEPFRVLLSYMRLGKVEASELTLPVLLQAKFFGMEQLLAAVRYVARRSDDESPLLAAARAAEIVPKVDKRDFARLCLIHKNMCFDGQEDLDVSDGREIVAVVEQDEEATQTRTYMTFIDGLNWLHRRGFTRYEQKADIDLDGGYDEYIGLLHFSKIATDNNYTEDHANTIIGATISTREKKEFAASISVPLSRILLRMESWIEADIGKEEDKNRRQLRRGIVKSRVSRISCETNEIPGLLQKHGFLTREEDLEPVYRKALCYGEDDLENSDSPLVKIWSRDVES
eukprot:scaffold146825_cov42-Cyclotella_meneghiniana.AAC.1